MIRRLRPVSTGNVLALLLLAGSHLAHSQTAGGLLVPVAEQPGYIKFHVSEQGMYDDNLYRLPTGYGNLNQLVIPGAQREDYINRATVGTDDLWSFANQSLAFRFDVSDNRFRHNSFLDYTSDTGSLRWNWSLASRWTGQVGADFSRSLTSFTNNRVFAKDLLETRGYFLTANYRLSSGWALTYNGREARGTHGVQAQQINNSTNWTSSAGLAYRSGSDNVFGVDYRYNSINYDDHIVFDGTPFDQSNHENSAEGYFQYSPGVVTRIEGSAGYLQHRYPNSGIPGFNPDFSGVVWNVGVTYQPSDKTQVVLSAHRSLRTYLDTESDYFVSEVVSIAPVWTPIDRLRVSLELSRERQTYLGSNPDSIVLPDEPDRHDQVTAATATLAYSLVKRLELDLAYHYEHRNSTRTIYAYLDNMASATLRLDL